MGGGGLSAGLCCAAPLHHRADGSTLCFLLPAASSGPEGSSALESSEPGASGAAGETAFPMQQGGMATGGAGLPLLHLFE